jgi:hypothetical protein
MEKRLTDGAANSQFVPAQQARHVEIADRENVTQTAAAADAKLVMHRVDVDRLDLDRLDLDRADVDDWQPTRLDRDGAERDA